MRPFGKLEDSRSVEAITLGDPQGLQAEVLTYGAILRRLTFPVRGQRRDLILSLPTLGHYVNDRAYVGALVGRFGNRIANARFSLDGREYAVTANEGVNHLHGGALGFGKRLWRVLARNASDVPQLELGLSSPAGEEGYPGHLDVTATFAAMPDSLRIMLRARTDAATPVNLTYHPYFNLAADARVPATGQSLRIPASHYLPVRSGLIPTGEFASVEGSTFDFRRARPLAPPDPGTHAQLALAGGYDHCWVLDPGAECACELRSPDGDLTLTMRGNGPGLQFYNGQFLARAHPDIGSGVILEPQGLPNAPNEPAFPTSILRPGDESRAEIVYHLAS